MMFNHYQSLSLLPKISLRPVPLRLCLFSTMIGAFLKKKILTPFVALGDLVRKEISNVVILEKKVLLVWYQFLLRLFYLLNRMCLRTFTIIIVVIVFYLLSQLLQHAFIVCYNVPHDKNRFSRYVSMIIIRKSLIKGIYYCLSIYLKCEYSQPLCI